MRKIYMKNIYNNPFSVDLEKIKKKTFDIASIVAHLNFISTFLG